MERLVEELQAAGCVCYGMIDGQPVIQSDPYSAASTVIALHQPDDAIYITLDLETTAASLQTLLPSDPATEWEAYLAIQTNLIKALRHAAFNALDAEKTIYERIAEEGNFGLFNVAMQNLVASVEAQYPFPGDYGE